MLRASALKSSDLSLSPRHGLKLMRLIERVLLHRAAQLGEAPYRRRRLAARSPEGALCESRQHRPAARVPLSVRGQTPDHFPVGYTTSPVAVAH